MNVNKNSLKLYASSKAVIANFLSLPGNNRIINVIRRVKDLSDDEVEDCMQKIIIEFGNRHRDIEGLFLMHFKKINDSYKNDFLHFSGKRKLLLGAFFTKEYSIQAAALFNPSIVPHPDQDNLNPGEVRFIMSLRSTGEGHISSVVFKTGVADEHMNITLDKTDGYHTCLKKNESFKYTKDFIKQRMESLPWYKEEFLKFLPAEFTASEAAEILNENDLYQHESMQIFCNQFNEMLDSNYDLESSLKIPLNEKVIFPTARAECMGMEDVRFVRFKDGDEITYYGTYTAYNGKEIKTQLIGTADFDIFKIRTLYGAAIADKGMALFPEKVNGKFVMISRQGGEKINIMYSHDLYYWDTYGVLMEPVYTWELLQLGNCGSPIKTAKGWLLLTHGVGAMRTYVISAILLDLNNPSRIIGRLDKPFLKADESEREGYVPNVVYTCGFMLQGKMLIIPYAVSDSATNFATVDLNELLAEMK